MGNVGVVNQIQLHYEFNPFSPICKQERMQGQNRYAKSTVQLKSSNAFEPGLHSGVLQAGGNL